MSADSFRDYPNTSRSSDERSRNTQERDDLSHALERTEKLGKACSRSRSLIAPSTSSMEEATRRLEEPRKEVREAAEKRRADREAQTQDTDRNMFILKAASFLMSTATSNEGLVVKSSSSKNQRQLRKLALSHQMPQLTAQAISGRTKDLAPIWCLKEKTHR